MSKRKRNFDEETEEDVFGNGQPFIRNQCLKEELLLLSHGFTVTNISIGRNANFDSISFSEPSERDEIYKLIKSVRERIDVNKLYDAIPEGLCMAPEDAMGSVAEPICDPKVYFAYLSWDMKDRAAFVLSDHETRQAMVDAAYTIKG